MSTSTLLFTHKNRFLFAYFFPTKTINYCPQDAYRFSVGYDPSISIWLIYNRTNFYSLNLKESIIYAKRIKKCLKMKFLNIKNYQKKKNILNLLIFSKNSANNIKGDQNYLQWLYSFNLFKWNINSI